MTAKAEINILPWLASREAVGCVARHLGCAPEAAELRIIEEGEASRVRARGVTSEGYPVSLLPASWRGIDWDAGTLPSCEITNIELCCDDLIAVNLLPRRSEERSGWKAAQTLAWIIRRELELTPEMGKEIKPAQLKLSEAIAAHRINLWGRRPRSSQREPISNDLFSLSKYKVVVTPHGNLSTEPLRKQHDFEEEYKDDSKWHDIIFAEDEIRREWLPAGRAASAHESTEIAETGETGTVSESTPRASIAAVDSASEQPTVSPGLKESMPGPAPAVESPTEPKQPAPKKAVKRRRRPGPRPGTIDRFALADRALFPEMTTLIKEQDITAGEAARMLSGKIKGRGDGDSRIRRLAKRYRTEVEKLTATRRNS